MVSLLFRGWRSSTNGVLTALGPLLQCQRPGRYPGGSAAKVLELQWPPPSMAGASSGASVGGGGERDVVLVNPGPHPVAEDLSREYVLMGGVHPPALLITEGSGASTPDSLPRVEMQMALPPREADVAPVEWADEEMARAEPSA
jgi:hypothetical protein